MGALDGHDLPGCAALLGVSCRDYVAIGQSDRRIVATPSLETSGAVTRLRRWLTAGSPLADLSRLEFCGDDEVCALVVEVLSRVPAPVAWHGVEYVVWFEVGRSTAGWQGFAPTTRAPDGDQPHTIALCGRHDNESLLGIIAHELGHSWSRTVRANAPSMVRMSDREWTARTLLAAKIASVTPLARLWGYAFHTDEAMLRRNIAADQAASIELAEQLELEPMNTDSGAHIADRAAATHAGT
jgi:hypothetical protein